MKKSYQEFAQFRKESTVGEIKTRLSEQQTCLLTSNANGRKPQVMKAVAFSANTPSVAFYSQVTAKRKRIKKFSFVTEEIDSLNIAG